MIALSPILTADVGDASHSSTIHTSLHFPQNSADSIYRTQTSYNPTPETNKVHSSLKTIEAVSRFHITQHVARIQIAVEK